MSWYYTDTRYPEVDERRYRRFATDVAAEAWFAQNDPEGVAWEYPDVATYLAVERAQMREEK